MNVKTGDCVVRDFGCPDRGQQLTFENSVYLGSGSDPGFDLDTRGFTVLPADGASATDAGRPRCTNLNLASCNWLTPPSSTGGLCASGALTRTRQANADPQVQVRVR